jgi:galactofuranosylgalactofuranosylrhamnosyl-N-acetylglucosaminyl-diphospho-decaprenol beta-1,5/1,6-galactofuranosyltransferase
VTQVARAEPVTEDVVPEIVLQQFVLPDDADFDTLPLYVERGEVRPEPELKGKEALQVVPQAPRQEPVLPDTVLGRRCLQVPSGTRISTATYFNAFPASYWRRWTNIRQVTLRVRVSGSADVIVSRSNARGDQQRVTKQHVQDKGVAEFTLPLEQFGDGGWYWFDVVAALDGATIDGAEWVTSGSDLNGEQGHASVAITTFNRPDYCVALLNTLAADGEVLERIDTIFVVDQGSKKVHDDPGYAEVAARLGDRLQLVDQPNLGGSGGFARGMYEATYHSPSKYVLLLDDDVLVEPEGLLRALTFADLCRTQTIVGGHMLNMHVRSMVHAFGERVQRYRFFWGPAPHTKHAHDFAVSPLRATRWLHRRIDVDYNGWWMCLIPTDVVRMQGLSLPLFIKWDDADFGLRAQEAGVPTVSLPGAAVWHVPWTDKDDTIDWQAYYHARNRLVAALLHSPYPRGGSLIPESMAVQVKHALSMQYSSAELRLWALEDILSGPDHLHRDLGHKLAEIRAMRADQDDAVVAKDPIAFPPVRQLRPPKRGKDPTEPSGAVGRYVAAANGVLRQFAKIRPSSEVNPEAWVPAMDVRWWLLSRFDSAIVSTADGVGASWYKRDRTRFLDLMQRSAVLHRKLAAEWQDLREQYLAAVPEVTDPQAWIPTWTEGESS